MGPLSFLFSSNAGLTLQLPAGQLPVTRDLAVVLAIIAVVFVLFITQPVSIDTTAVGLVVALVSESPLDPASNRA